VNELAALMDRVARLAADRESGASELRDTAIGILGDALHAGVPVRPVAQAVCRAQPSMAPLWNAALEAIAAEVEPARFERFAQRIARMGAALSRSGAEHLLIGAGPGPIHLVTLSFSGAVVETVAALRAVRPVLVACSESRPALEGRRLAARLAAAGTPVTCFGDAALGHALAAADAVVVGADAVGPEWFLNKSGTRMLATAATQQGIPVYVLATRDKFVNARLAGRLTLREGDADELWPAPPPGIVVRNPYFEAIPLDLVSAVVSDTGVFSGAMVRDVCAAVDDAALGELLAER
jgi:translation initiation factor 2B subunit (eIF-2B alpha/beta/delta family)